MIPYFTIPLFSVMISVGILVGMVATSKRSLQLGLGESITPVMLWAVGVGLPSAHVFDVLTYHTSKFVANPLMMFDPREGWSISSYGGFLGALVTVAFWTKYRKLPLMPYLDALAVGITVGFLFGRLGCFFVHDHIGRETNFFFAVAFPDAKRHDLGLDEFIICLFMSLWFFFLIRKPRPVGTYAALASIIYAPVRFFLDFLRADDIPNADSRYFGLTPAQYCSIVATFIGLWLSMSLLLRARSRNVSCHIRQKSLYNRT